MDLPFVCNLSPEELRERRQAILDSVRESSIRIEELADGFAYLFHADSNTLLRLAQLVDLERQCCQFLTFRIVVEPQRSIRLEVTGPATAKPVIADFFGS